MLYTEIQTYRRHYFLLIVGLAIFLSFFVVVQNSLAKLCTALIIGAFYTAWGIVVHHARILTVRLMLEYALFGILGAVILISLIHNV